MDDPRTRATVEVLRNIASEYGNRSPAEIAIAWLLRKAGVTSVILGARNHQQLTANLGAASIRLDDDAMRRLNKVSAVPPRYPMRHHIRAGRERASQLPETVDYQPI